MTRKDYAIIARALMRGLDGAPVSVRHKDIDEVATALTADNPRFNRIRFVNFATGCM